MKIEKKTASNIFYTRCHAIAGRTARCHCKFGYV